MGTAAGGSSLLSLGLSAGSSIMQGLGQKSSLEMEADKAQRAAAFGRLQADLTDTSFRENLRNTLGNIDAIRAAGNVSPDSPTTAAVEDRARTLSERQRRASLLSIRSQVAENEAGAAYLREAGNYALLTSIVGAGAKVAKGIGQSNMFDLGGGGGGGGYGFTGGLGGLY